MNFNVGDWVRHIDSNNIYHVNGFSVHGQTKGWLQVPDEYHLIPSTECELWLPKEDEWVVCSLSKTNDIFYVVRYNEHVIISLLENNQYGDIVIEPFIGVPPSFLKENK